MTRIITRGLLYGEDLRPVIGETASNDEKQQAASIVGAACCFRGCSP